MDRSGTLLVADTGSTNGTHINGVRIPYGEARPIAAGDVVAFGEVEVRFRRLDS
jgi:pSer/pThr/pTyr-binding forkhead associated (FHA) protein